MGARVDRGGLRRYRGRGDEDAPRRDHQRIRDQEPRVPENARPGIPAAVWLHRVVDTHGYDIWGGTVAEVRGNVVGERRVAIGPSARLAPVDPDRAALVDPVEPHGHPLAACALG